MIARVRHAAGGLLRRAGALRAWLRRVGRSPDWGTFRRLEPLSRAFGGDRGTPIDRHYILEFLSRHADDVRGRTLEVGDPTYTRRFGADQVTRSDVLHATAGNPTATLVGDLASGEGVPRDSFDCLLLTQVYSCVFDLPAAVLNSHQALREGGVLLATLPGLTQISI